MSSVDLTKLKKDLIDECWYVALNEHVIDLAWSPDSTKLVAATVDGRIVLIDNRGDSAFFRQVGLHTLGANSVCWSCDGSRFASSGQDGLVQVFDASHGELLHSTKLKSSWVAKVAFQPMPKDSSNTTDKTEPPVGLLAAAAGKSLVVYDETGNIVYESADHVSTIADVAWNPRGDTIAVAAYHGVTLHKPSGGEVRKFDWQGSSLVAAWSPDERFIATGEQDSTVHFWMVDSGEHAQMWGFPTKVLQLSWNATGRWLATGGGSGVVIWDCSGPGPMGRQPEILECHVNKITTLAYQPGGEYLVSADADGLLCVWEPSKHKDLIGGKSLTAAASCLRWSDSGKHLAVGQADGIVVVFSAPR